VASGGAERPFKSVFKTPLAGLIWRKFVPVRGGSDVAKSPEQSTPACARWPWDPCWWQQPAGAADYFAGKSIDLLIGAPPAGGYDIYARTLARHLGRYIPGQPNIIAKNMPGAASGRAAGFLSTIAPKDGTVIAAIMPGAVMGPLLDEKAEVLFGPHQGAISRHRQ